MNTYISHPAAFCNTAKPTLNSILSNSNSVPHIWYHKIVYKTGKPDNVRITILAELLQLHLNTGSREFQPGCAYLQNKFNYTYDQVYEALVGLEKQALIGRKGKTITFNIENVLALSTEQKDDNSTPKKIDTFTDKNTKDSSLNIDLYIDILEEDIEVKRDNSISGASFDVKLPEQKPNQGNNPQGIIKTAKRWVRNLKPKPLSSFHPLTEEDAESLRLSSGREFNLHFINQLILRLSTKYPNHSFYTKRLFLKYMTAILANEMRQAVNVNNEGFRFKATNEEGVAEEYLARVEDGYGNKASDQVRRKVAATFEPTIAYKILTSCYFPEEATQGYYEIKQRTPFELSESQQDRLHSQISAVFGDSVKRIAITDSYAVAKKAQSSTLAESQVTSLDTTTLWGRVRSGLIATYGEAIDKSWFSRLETSEDTSSRSLILKGTSFLTDYIQTNYSHVIERLCREENYQLKFC